MEPSARILGHLLLMQSALHALPDSDARASFLGRGLQQVPGVADAVLCVGPSGPGRHRPDSEAADPCSACAHEPWPDAPYAPIGHRCPAKDDDARVVFDMATARGCLGHVLLQVDDGEAFETYRPFILSTVNLLALLTETDHQSQELHASHDAMQRKLLGARRLEALGRLAGGLAHDFNNLMTVVLLVAREARASLRPQDPLRDDFSQILSAAERATGLIAQLLAFSRRQVLKPEVVDLNAVIGGMEHMLARLLGDDIVLRTDLAPDLPRIEADVAQFEQVIMNLAVNARDAMPEGGELTIQSRPAPPTGSPRQAVVSIRDTGNGMDERTRAQAFEPFFSTKEPGQGTGLGLSTVHGIISQSGGAVEIESEPGQGTTVLLRLPVTGHPIPAAPDQPARSQPDAAGGPETILVVDDEAMIGEIARRILSGRGYSVLVAEGGDTARRAVEAHAGTIDLLLTDLIMPGQRGDALAEDLRAIHPGLRVVYMSGYAKEAVDRNGQLDEDALFVAKPFEPEDLLRIVRQALDG